MFALIHSGTVIEISETDFPVHKNLQWVDITLASPRPDIGWSYEASIFTAPPPPQAPTMTEQRRAAYPDMTDQLDVIWKHISAMQSSGVKLDSVTKNMLADIEAVKSTFPE